MKFMKQLDHMKLKGRGFLIMDMLEKEVLMEFERQVEQAFITSGSNKFEPA